MSTVIYYTTEKGENPVSAFIAALTPSQKAKILRILTYIRNYGLVTAIPHIKKLSGTSLWEIRVLGQDNIRVLYIKIEDDAVLLLHGFIKKKQKTPEKELRTALSRLRTWKDFIKQT